MFFSLQFLEAPFGHRKRGSKAKTSA